GVPASSSPACPHSSAAGWFADTTHSESGATRISASANCSKTCRLSSAMTERPGPGSEPAIITASTVQGQALMAALAAGDFAAGDFYCRRLSLQETLTAGGSCGRTGP